MDVVAAANGRAERWLCDLRHSGGFDVTDDVHMPMVDGRGRSVALSSSVALKQRERTRIKVKIHDIKSYLNFQPKSWRHGQAPGCVNLVTLRLRPMSCDLRVHFHAI